MTNKNDVARDAAHIRLKAEIEQLYINIDDIFKDDVENNKFAKSYLRQAEQVLAKKGASLDSTKE